MAGPQTTETIAPAPADDAPPIVLVVFGLGSLSPTEILQACANRYRPVFVVLPQATLPDGMLDLLYTMGDVTDGDTERLRALGPRGIVTFSDALLEETARIAALLGLPFHTTEVAQALADKLTQRELLQDVCEVGFARVSAHAEVDAAVRAVGAPGVVKPARGTGSHQVHLVTSEARARSLIHRLLDDGVAPLIYEELLQGDPNASGEFWADVVSVETVMANGVPNHLSTTGRFPFRDPFRESGCFMPARLSEDVAEAVYALVDEALAALGVTRGVHHTEVKLTPNGPMLVEVNGRLGGFIAELLRTRFDFDVARWVFDEAVGSPTTVLLAEPRCIPWVRLIGAPSGSSRVTNIDGVADVRRVPGVSGLQVWRHEGDETPTDHGLLSTVAIVRGQVADFRTLEETVRAVDAVFVARYD